MVDSQIVKVSTIRLSLFFNGKCKELWRNRSVQNVNFTIYNGIFLYYRFFFANACFGLRVANIGHLLGLCRSFPKHYGLNFFGFPHCYFVFLYIGPFSAVSGGHTPQPTTIIMHHIPHNPLAIVHHTPRFTIILHRFPQFLLSF